MKFSFHIRHFLRTHAMGLPPASTRRGLKTALLLSSLLCPLTSVPLLAQVDFGSVNIGSSNTATVTVTFPFAGTLLQRAVFTGGTPNLDFTDAGGGTCAIGTAYAANATCTVQVNFAPKYAGERYGMVELEFPFPDWSTNSFAVAYIHGIGLGPQLAFPSQMNTQFLNPAAAAVDPSGDVFVVTPKYVLYPCTPDSIIYSPFGGYVSESYAGNGGSSPQTGAILGRYGNNVHDYFDVTADGGGIITVGESIFGDTQMIPQPNGIYFQNAYGPDIEAPGGALAGESGPPWADGFGNSYFVSDKVLYKRTLQWDGSYSETAVSTGFSDPQILAVGLSGIVVVRDGDAGGSCFPVQPLVNIDIFNYSQTKPSNLQFDQTVVGSTSSDSPQTVTLSNSGNSPLNLTGISYPRDFRPSTGGVNACTFSTTLQQGESCNISIRFKPQEAGPLSEAVVVTSNSLNQSGNQQSIRLNGTGILGDSDNQIQLLLSASTFAFPGSTIVTVQLSPGSNPAHAPTGTVQLILDGNALPAILNLSGAGHGYAATYYDLAGVAAGWHSLYAVYSGDASNPAGYSASVSFDVFASPVKLEVSCQNSKLVQGADYKCEVYTGPVAAGVGTVITYKYDNAAAVDVLLSGGFASFSIPTPAIGPHTVAISYSAQGNYAAASPVVESFTVVAP